MPPSQVVELLGPPASGKSSVAAALAQWPGVVVLKDHEPADLAPLTWSAATAWPVLSLRPPAGVRWSRWAAWAGRLGAAPRVVRRRLVRGAGVVVLDQGPAYTLGRLDAVRRDPAGARWWQARSADCADLLDLLVLLDADHNVLLDRLRSRSKEHQARDLDDAAAARYLAAEQATCRLVAETVENRGATVVRIDTGRGSASEHGAAVAGLLTAAGDNGGRG